LQRRGWQAGFLDHEADDAPAGTFARLMADERPVLIVVDYAETRREVLVRLLRRMRWGTAPRLRLVLLARAAAEWWQTLGREDRDAREMMAAFAEAPAALRPLADDAAARRAVFDAAAAAFARRLGGGADRAAAPNLAAPHFANVLLIHVAALAAVRGRRLDDAQALLRAVLDRDQGSWELGLEDLGLSPRRYRRAVAEAVTLATLAGGAGDEDGLASIVARAPELGQAEASTVGAIGRLLARLYPDASSLGALRPDLLGEQLVAEELQRSAGLLDAAFAGTPTTQHKNGLRVLTRLAMRRPEEAALLDRALACHGERLAETVVAVGLELGGTILERVVAGLRTADEPERLALARALQPHLPWPTTVARELNAEVEATLLARQRIVAAGNGERARADLARLLSNFGIRLSELNRREGALAAEEEAVTLYRVLADARPETFAPELARSLSNLGIQLAELNRRRKALAATEEAVTLYRTLALKRPETFDAELARSLSNLGVRLSELNRHQEALAATEEAVAFYRRLARDLPAAFSADLAASLSNLGIRLAQLDRCAEALAAEEAAVALYRTLAQARPDAFRPDLAASLSNLGIELAHLQRREEALAATEEAVALYRSLARARPDAFNPDLAASLSNLGIRLAQQRRTPEALAATEEAVALYRGLARARPEVFDPDLARSLSSLGVRLETVGRSREALLADREAVQRLAPSFLRLPQAFGPLMGSIVTDYRRLCAAAGEMADAALLAPIEDRLRPGH
jgi:hypothetical protein